MARTGSAAASMSAVLGISLDSLSHEWHAAVKEAYGAPSAQLYDPDAYGRAVKRGGSSIDLFVGDLTTGRIERKLVDAVIDPPFESLQFLRSAGSWHPDGRRFVLAAVRSGRPVLSELDTESGEIIGEIIREFSLPGVDEAFTPSWSPDGAKIVFAGNAGGLASSRSTKKLSGPCGKGRREE